MYGFRYHLVTVVAVFMALGIGLLLGGSMGQELIFKQQMDLFNRLQEKYTVTKTENTRLVQKSTDLTLESKQFNDMMRQVIDHVVSGKLTGKHIAVIQLDPVGTGSLDHLLEAAGATVDGTVRLLYQLPWQDTSYARYWSEARGVSANAGSQQLAMLGAQATANQVLGARVYTTNQNWLTYLQTNGLVEWAGNFDQRPDAIIVVGGSGTEERQRMEMFDTPLLQELQKANIRLVAVERSDVSVSAMPAYRQIGIPTVDNIDQASGEVALVDVLSGLDGHFGRKNTADSLLPTNSLKGAM